MRVQKSFLAGSLLTLLLTGSFAFGQGNMKAGMIEIHPYLDFSVVSDDNIYLQKDNAKSATITKIKPGIGISLPVEKHKFSLGYNAEIQNYSINTSTINAKNHTVSGAAELKFPSDIILNVKDTYKNTTDQAFSELVERVKREQNNFSAEAGLMSTDRKISVTANFAQELHRYIQNAYRQNLNRTINTPGLNLYFNYSPKTSLVLAYNMGTIAYQDSSNVHSSKYDEIMLGAKGDLAPKTVGLIKLGVHMRKYDKLKDSAGKLQEFNEMIAIFGTKTNFSGRTNMELTVSRAPVESIYGPNAYNVSTYAGIKLNQKIGNKLSLSINGASNISDYPKEMLDSAGVSKKRQDTISSAGLNVSYPLQDWINIIAGYALSTRSSNFSVFDYTDKQVNAGIHLIF